MGKIAHPGSDWSNYNAQRIEYCLSELMNIQYYMAAQLQHLTAGMAQNCKNLGKAQDSTLSIVLYFTNSLSLLKGLESEHFAKPYKSFPTRFMHKVWMKANQLQGVPDYSCYRSIW